MYTSPIPIRDPYLIPFTGSIHEYALPSRFSLMLNNTPHPLCLLAAQQLQFYLKTQQEWAHNFGLTPNGKGSVIGKMFGVLVVQTQQNEIGYLCAFSGKLAGANTHTRFVPPIFDALTESGFLNPGMLELKTMTEAIHQLELDQPSEYETQIKHLKTKRKNHSIALQQQLFEHYHCLNAAGEAKNLLDIFKTASYKNPPAGAAECATPKLLQYAFQHQYKPLAVAEFWWGQSPKSAYWKHGEFYPCCKEKCEPILAHMLSGLEVVIS
jgi:tRNA pseudouridine32 synthase/23S rRNA pseudouridine746 synthase